MTARHLSRHPVLVIVVALSLALGTMASTLRPAHAAPAASRAAAAQGHAAVQRWGGDTIILVHGINSQSSVNCSDTWNTITGYLGQYHTINGQSLRWGRQDFREIQFYDNDSSCGVRTGANAPSDPRPNGWSSEDLHNPLYTQQCSGYHPDGTNGGEDGTNNESIYHLSCLFDWYLYYNFQPSWNVEIVAHSMGGLIVRNGIYQVAQNKAPWTMPPTMPNISDVVTFATPHGGMYLTNVVSCSSCTQGNEMVPGSYFMNEMYNSAQNPTWGGTDWTMMGSDCDAVSTSSATYMSGGHKSYFTTYNFGQICYDHGGYLFDSSDATDAHIFWCDGCSTDPPLSSWNYWGSAPRSLYHMMYALWLSNW